MYYNLNIFLPFNESLGLKGLNNLECPLKSRKSKKMKDN